MKAFGAELHESELMKPFLRFLLLIFLAAKNPVIGNKRLEIENESEINLMHKDHSCHLRDENIHLGASFHCPLLKAGHCRVTKEYSVVREPPMASALPEDRTLALEDVWVQHGTHGMLFLCRPVTHLHLLVFLFWFS